MPTLDQRRTEETGTAAFTRQLSRAPARLGKTDRTPPIAMATLLVLHGLGAEAEPWVIEHEEVGEPLAPQSA